MIKNIEKIKELKEQRKSYLEDMKTFAEMYERSSEDLLPSIEKILKTLGNISLLIKKEIDELTKK